MTNVEGAGRMCPALNAEITQLAETVDRRERPYDRVPLAIMMRRTLCDLLNAFRPAFFKTSVIAAIAIGTLLYSPSVRWLATAVHIGASITLLVGALVLTNISWHVLKRIIGLHIASYIFAAQHDRAMAALRLSLVEGRPLLLYLRPFRAEESSEESLHLERMIVDVAKDEIVVVSLLNPATDPTLRMSRIPKLLYPSHDWQLMIELLCRRAERILVAVSVTGEVDEGLADEMQLISRLGLSRKTLLVRLGAELADQAWTDRFEWNVSLPSQNLFEHGEVWEWLGMLASVSPRNPSPETQLCPRYWSRRPRLLLAAAYLEGLSSLLPSSAHSFYRRWLSLSTDLDPLEDVRLRTLAAERAAYAAGQEPEPMDLLIHSKNPAIVKMHAQRAEAKRLERQLETAQFILFEPAAWSRLRLMLRACR